MSLATLAATAAGYVLKAFGKSKKVTKIKEELAEALDNEVKGLWDWIRPIFIMEKEEKLVSKIEETPEEEKTRNILEFKLEEKLEKDPDFKAALEEKVEKIKAIEKSMINITNISDAGIISMGSGSVKLEGDNVAGRDMTVNINKPKDDD